MRPYRLLSIVSTFYIWWRIVILRSALLIHTLQQLRHQVVGEILAIVGELLDLGQELLQALLPQRDGLDAVALHRAGRARSPIDDRREPGDRRVLEQLAQRQIDMERVADVRYHLGCRQRVAADIEE